MAKVVVKSKIKKAKRKFPVQLVAPEYLNSVNLGKSNVTDLNSVVGMTAKINLMYITKSRKNQNIRLVFKVVEVASGLAKTRVVSYIQIPYYLGRYVKTGSNLVEDSIVIKSKDDVDIRVKPFIVTKQQTSTMVLSAIRAKAKELIEKEVSGKTADEFMNAVITSKIQNKLRSAIKKVFPVKTFEFKKIEF